MLDGHYNGQTATFAIPADFLTVGTNVVIIRVAPDPNAHSYLWLYNVAVGNSTVQNSQCKLPSRSLKKRFLPLIHRAFLSLENLLGFTHYTGIRENTWHY